MSNFALALGALSLAAVMLTASGAARAQVRLDDASASARVTSPAITVLEDAEGALDIGDVRARDAEFAPFPRPVPNFGFTRSAIWARIEIEDARAVPGPLVMAIEYAPLDHAVLYDSEHDAPIGEVGDVAPFDQRDVRYRFPAFRLPARSGPQVYYLRASGQSSLQLPLRVHTAEGFESHLVSDMAAQGLYVGIVLAMIAYNLFLYAGVRARGYLLYSLFMALYAVYQTSIEGLAYQYLWPGSPWLAERAIPLSVGLAAIFGILFAQRYLGTRESAPRMHRAGLVFCAIVAAFLPFAALVEARIALRVTSVLALAFGVLGLALGLVRLRQGGRPARFFLVAWSLFLVGAILAALRVSGVVPTNALTMNIQEVGSALEGVLLSIGLADRIRSMQEHAAAQERQRFDEQKRAAAELETLNEELRRQIAERSREIAELLGRTAYHGLEDVAPGTIFDGRYRVVRALGAGGMGAVHEVERQSDGRRFALKVLAAGGSPSMAARFAREAEIAAKLRHPHLVTIVDFGVSSSSTMFLVMELVEGHSIEAERQRFGDASWALPLLAQIADGLEELHARSIVHRDLKPANVLLQVARRDTPLARIADFGLSRVDVDSMESSQPGDAATSHEGVKPGATSP